MSPRQLASECPLNGYFLFNWALPDLLSSLIRHRLIRKTIRKHHRDKVHNVTGGSFNDHSRSGTLHKADVFETSTFVCTQKHLPCARILHSTQFF